MRADPDTLRLVFWRVDLQTTGPGLALRDIRARASRALQVSQLVAHLDPDILVLSGLDQDLRLVTLGALRDLMAEHGVDYPHLFAPPGNAGLRTGLDLNGDARRETPDDAQGYGIFPGQKGLALLSRYPIDLQSTSDFTSFLWAALPRNTSPHATNGSMADAAVHDVQRLSSTSHWDVAVDLGSGRRLQLLAWQAGPPAFGGDRNRARNRDETAFWLAYLDGHLPMQMRDAPFVLIGGSNLDPFDGDGDGAVMQAVLSHPRVQDPQPSSLGALASAQSDPRSAMHLGPHALDTVEWPQANGPGNLRVSYILPMTGLHVRQAGVFWPAPDDPLVELLGTETTSPSRHRPVWVDLDLRDWPKTSCLSSSCAAE